MCQVGNSPAHYLWAGWLHWARGTMVRSCLRTSLTRLVQLGLAYLALTRLLYMLSWFLSHWKFVMKCVSQLAGIYISRFQLKNVVIFLKADDFMTFWWYYFESIWWKYLVQISRGMDLRHGYLKYKNKCKYSHPKEFIEEYLTIEKEASENSPGSASVKTLGKIVHVWSSM